MSAGDSLNISLDGIIETTANEINRLLSQYSFIYEVVAFIVAAIALFYVCRGIYVQHRRSVNSKLFIVYCLVVMINTVGAGVIAMYGDKVPPVVQIIAIFALLCLPALFCLHTWSQVDYKPIKKSIALLYFLVPIILSLINVYYLLMGEFKENVWNILSVSSFSIQNVLFFIYWLAMVFKCLSLCFNVFYQMPKHMRASTMALISARIILAIAVIFEALNRTDAAYLVVLVSFAIAMNRMMAGFFRANASNVIATSRQFVFSNLSTMVLVLSLKGRILEWNKPEGESLFTFVRPKYLQPFEEYKEALLAKGKGVVSPHDENIVTLSRGDEEKNLMFTSNPITERTRKYGTLIEIFEITSIYSKLRVLESIAELDYMTGLHNRNAYMNKAEEYMKTEYMPLLILIGDVNNLKMVNDTYSHLSGDRLLCRVADVIKRNASQDAFIARIGGDEIVLLIPQGDEHSANEFMNKVYNNLQEEHDSEFGYPSISFGWSIVYSPTQDYNAAFEKADEMMYEQKRAFKQSNTFTLAGSLPKKSEAYDAPVIVSRINLVQEPTESEPVSTIPATEPAPTESSITDAIINASDKNIYQ